MPEPLDPTLVMVGRFRNARGAETTRRVLREAGVESWLESETGVLLPPKRRSVRLFVKRDDVDTADQVLNDLYGVAHAERVGPSDEEPYPDLCPNCGSNDVRRVPRAVLFITACVAVIAFGFIAGSDSLYFFFGVATVAIAMLLLDWRECLACGERWK